MSRATVIRAAVLLVAVVVAFASGYFASGYENGRAMESLVYTDLLTDTRARLRTIGAIDRRQTEEERRRLVMELRSRVAILEQFKDSGKLGGEAGNLLEEAKRLVESDSRK